jgi:hypothetical protein
VKKDQLCLRPTRDVSMLAMLLSLGRGRRLKLTGLPGTWDVGSPLLHLQRVATRFYHRHFFASNTDEHALWRALRSLWDLNLRCISCTCYSYKSEYARDMRTWLRLEIQYSRHQSRISTSSLCFRVLTEISFNRHKLYWLRTTRSISQRQQNAGIRQAVNQLLELVYPS